MRALGGTWQGHQAETEEAGGTSCLGVSHSGLGDVPWPSFRGRDKQVSRSFAVRKEGGAHILEMGSCAHELRSQCLERKEWGRVMRGLRVSWARHGGAHL